MYAQLAVMWSPLLLILLLLRMAPGTHALGKRRTPVTVEAPKHESLFPLPEVAYQVVVEAGSGDDGGWRADACGGAVVGRTHVLTAASCVLTPHGDRAPWVRVNLVPIAAPWTAAAAARSYRVLRATFFDSNVTRVDGDVVLLQVERELTFDGKVVEPLPLQTQKGFRSKNCYLISWLGPESQFVPQRGVKRSLRMAGHVAGLRVTGLRRCVGTSLAPRPPADGLCLGRANWPPRDTCLEPAGAPAVCDGHLTALAMGTRGCGWLHFALYVDASFYAPWVSAEVAAGEARSAVREKLEDAGGSGDGSRAKGRHPEPISPPSPPPRR